MPQAIQQNNKKTNNTNKNGTKHNKFIKQIEEIAREYEFDPTSVLSTFKSHNISSSDFTLHKFQNKRTFVVEFSNQRCQITTARGNLIKLWKALIKKYNLLSNRPCKPTTINPAIWNTKSLVYIPPQSTKHIIDIQLIKEPFLTAKGLYQYLNWTIRVNKINKFIKIFKANNGIEILVINSELHDKYGNMLYMLCIENDIVSTKSQQWQFVKLVTDQEIYELFTNKKELLIAGYINNIDCSVSNGCSVQNVSRLIAQYADCVSSVDSIELPSGARANAAQFRPVRENRLLSKETIRNKRLSQSKYRQLKSVRTGYDKKSKEHKDVLQVTTSQFYQRITDALNSNDQRHKLIPIVSILTGKKYPEGQYNVDQLLPVEIEGNWIGIVYRDGLPVMTLIDGYDITNKAVLCDPSFDKSRLEWFTNNITKLEIGNSARRGAVAKKKGHHQTSPAPQHNTVNAQCDRYGYGQWDKPLDDKVDNRYTEGNMSTTSTDSNTINHINTVTDGVADNVINNNTTTFNAPVATLPSTYIGSYSFRSYGTTQQQLPLYTTTTATTTATNLLMPPQSVALEGFINTTNNILQIGQLQAQYFGQFANNLNVTTNVLTPSYTPQSHQTVNIQ